jgi:hypothetical protein
VPQPSDELAIAAADLAATLRAARAGTGKQAAEWGDTLRNAWSGISPEAQSMLGGTAIGAGVGGLGGLVAGMGDRKRKNPLASALTGALGGGALGLASGGAYALAQQMGTKPTATTGAAAQAAADNKTLRYKEDNPIAHTLTTGAQDIGALAASNPVGAISGGGVLGLGAIRARAGNRAGALERGITALIDKPSLSTVAPADVDAASYVANRARTQGPQGNWFQRRLDNDLLSPGRLSGAQNKMVANKLGPTSRATLDEIRRIGSKPEFAPKRNMGRLAGYAGAAGLAANFIPKGLDYITKKINQE